MSRLHFCLLVLLLPVPGLASAPPDSADVVITEVMYAPSPSENEYVELYNRSDRAVNLGRLEFADENRSFTRIASMDTLLAPGTHAVLVRDSVAFATAFPQTDAFVPGDWSALNNGGDTVVLRHGPSTTTLDAVPYAPEWGGDNGAALERIDPDGPSDRATNFASSEAADGGTPGARNSVYDPDDTPPTLQSVRPRPSGDSIIATFSEPLDANTVNRGAFTLDAPKAPAIGAAAVSDTLAAQVVCTVSRSLSTNTYRLVASDVSDRQGNIRSEASGVFEYFVPGVPSRRDVVITEIQYAPSDGSSEYIEIFNRSGDTVDLGQLAYADEQKEYTRIAPRLTPLGPDSHAVVARNADAFHRAFPDVDVHAPGDWEALNNGGDTVHLRYEPASAPLDAVPYTPSWGGDGPASLERVDPAGPSNAADNFGTSTAQTGGTPGARNSLYDPDTEAPSPIFAEQRTSTELWITFGEPLHEPSVTARSFRAGNTSVTDAQLRRDSIAVVTLETPPSNATIEIDGVQDRVGNEATGSIPVAFRPASGMLVVNEILFDPRTDDFDNRPNQVEYIELTNRSDRRLSLNGLVRTDRPDERGAADTLRLGRRVALPPNGRAVVAAAPGGARRPEQSRLAAAFPDAPLTSDSVAYLPVYGARLGLENDGDRIRLHRRDGTVLSTVDYTPDWHTPSLEDATGTALERISTSGPSSDADNWTSSTASRGGTPGRPNAVSLSPPADAPNRGLTIHPSPFSIERDGATRIRYALKTVPNLVRVRIFDARGRKVRTLEEARLAGRTGELLWNGRDDAGHRVRVGIYVVLFEAMQPSAGTIARFKKPVVVARPLKE